ncbi:PhnD/SsuA/transferrin family substrate-binding protein [Amphritea balenae]|nr:PhnD/SsuA/transferrin family substrate-binding protein [Amphritea balenae]GGK69411.1 hypothetical protein GCM10007941_19500 [Amphritea balenae]
MDKVRLLVPSDDTAQNAERWYEFAIYISRHTDTPVTPLIASSISEYKDLSENADLAYAFPDQICRLINHNQMTPFAQPVNCYEEAVIVAGPSAPKENLSAIHSASLGGVKGSFAHRLGLTLLHKKQIRPSTIIAKSSMMALLRGLQSGELQYALLSNDFLEQLSPLSREGINLLARSHIAKAFPVLMFAPTIKPLAPTLLRVLLQMSEDPKGRQILLGLNIPAWIRPEREKLLTMLAMLRG